MDSFQSLPAFAPMLEMSALLAAALDDFFLHAELAAVPVLRWEEPNAGCQQWRIKHRLTCAHMARPRQIVAKFPDVTEDNIIQLGPNHVIFSDYYTFELTKDGKLLYYEYQPSRFAMAELGVRMQHCCEEV